MKVEVVKMAKKENNNKPWERQDGETAKQFEAFRIYRDLGEERSLLKTGEALGKRKALMERWGSANNWVERALAWDCEKDRIARNEQIKDVKKMRSRHATVGQAMIATGAKALKELKPESLNAQDIARLIAEGSKLERISRGDVGEVIEQRDGGEAMSNVEIYKAQIPDNTRQDEDDFDDLEV